MTFRIEKLNERHERKKFKCGKHVLDHYIRKIAPTAMSAGTAVVYVLLEDDSNRAIAYYTLTSAVILLDEIPEGSRGELGKYRQVGATLLGRLAIDKEYKGRKLGATLVSDACRNALAGASIVASHALLVEAIDDAAAAFYEHLGFVPLLDDPSRLYLPLASLGKL